MPLQFDCGYPRTFLGAAHFLQFLLGILVLICIAVADIIPTGKGFVYFVAAGSLITSLVFLILYIIHLPESGPCAKLPWELFQFALLAFWTLLYLISGIMTAAWASKYKWTVDTNANSAYGAASFFCFAATLLYGICAYIYYRRWRRPPVATASVTVTERHTTTTGARY